MFEVFILGENTDLGQQMNLVVAAVLDQMFMITGFQKPCFQRTISTSGFPMRLVKMFCQHHSSLELLLLH